MPQAPEYVSVPVAAEVLGSTDVWVLRLLREGTLEGFKLNGRAWAVKRTSLEKNLKEYLTRDPSHAGRKRSRIG